MEYWSIGVLERWGDGVWGLEGWICKNLEQLVYPGKGLIQLNFRVYYFQCKSR
jgi:hypothetical protein